MKNFFTAIVLFLLTTGSALALNVAGVEVASTANVAGQTLTLNGAGIRSKFFIKVYVGALYSRHKLSSAAEVLADPGSKLIRMYFVHSRVAKEKIVDAFSEGFANNTPQLTGTPEVAAFLALFKNDFVEGDSVDLALASDGAVSASHNGRLLGTVSSPLLVRGVLGIYFGDEPADKDLKAGMLGLP